MALLQHSCPHCKTVRMPLQIAFVSKDPKVSTDWDVALLCPGCSKLSVATVREANHAGKQPNNGNALINDHWHVIAFSPATQEVSAPRHCKDPVASTYKQAMLAMGVGAWMPAAMALRKVLETATKELDANLGSMTLEKRIDELNKAGKLPDGLKEFAHLIRLEGNDAAHDTGDVAKEEAKQLQDFVELFLKYVFTLPGEVREALGRHPGLEKKLIKAAGT